jgi:hypothetical protein
VSRDVQHRLHTALTAAADALDLPLDSLHLERLAVELAPAVTALLTEPEPYAAADDVEESQVDGCCVRTQLDVDLDSPAARLGLMLRTSQHDVIATEIPDGDTLGLTVRPQSLDCWRWWMGRMGVTPAAVVTDGEAVTATGSCEGVTVHLRGEGVPELLVDRGAARLIGVLAPSRP